MPSYVQVHNPGDTVTLVCRTDSYWEYCSWSHKQRQCNLEWKYSKVRLCLKIHKVLIRDYLHREMLSNKIVTETWTPGSTTLATMRSTSAASPSAAYS